MTELRHGGLLHNMSAPPKTTISWRGLTSLREPPGSGQGDASILGPNPASIFGTPVRFSLSPAIAAKSPHGILLHLGCRRGPDPAAELRALIDTHAATLPLPAGCAVIGSLPDHLSPWTDTLTVLAVLTKSSGSVWLRAKTPTLSALPASGSLSLLIPPAFATRIPGASS